jgi:phytoene synthase
MTPDALSLHAEATIAEGSQSFAAASRLFDRSVRRGALALYAWCRHCDDVVDGQVLGKGQVASDTDPAERLASLERQTRAAYASDGPIGNPAFAALQYVARRHRVPLRYPMQLLAGFRMDVEGRRYRSLDDTLDYAYHVAGVVGVMMTIVMGRDEPEVLDRAADLGIGLQLTNIARDVIEDAAVGRVYLPEDWLDQAGVSRTEVAALAVRPAVSHVVACLLAEADRYYASANQGLRALPLRSAAAVGAAQRVYGAIGEEVLHRGPRAWDERIATSGGRKLALVASGALGAAMVRFSPVKPRDPTLYARPR